MSGHEASVYALAAVVEREDRSEHNGPLRQRLPGAERRPGAARLRRGDYGAPLRPLATAAWRRWYTAVVVALDLAVADAAAQLGLGLGLGRGLTNAVPAAAFAAVFVATLTLGRVYEYRFVEHGGQEFRRLSTAIVVVLAATGVLVAAVGDPARGLVLVAAPLAGLACLVGHLLARHVLSSLRAADAAVIGCC